MTRTKNTVTPAQVVKERPTEIVTGLATAGLVYGFCAESGVPNGVAAVIGVICGLGPLVISNTVDRIRRP